MQIAVAARALDNDRYCGDIGRYWLDRDRITLCAVDGLGHGQGAETAAKAALEYVGRNRCQPMESLFAGCDQALRDTRGVAMAVAVIDPAQRHLTYAGIGNIRTLIAGAAVTRLTGDNGIVGAGYRNLLIQTLAIAPDDLIVLFSDGLPEMIELSNYGEDLRADAERLAHVLLRDWATGKDDALVLVCRND